MTLFSRAIIAGSIFAVLFVATPAPSAAAPDASDQVDEIRKLPWQKSGELSVGNRASVDLGEDEMGLSEAQGGKFLELTGNLPSPGTSVILAKNWWAVLSYDESGYVKDDDSIDADALLKELQSRDGPANEERRRRGITALHTGGWAVPPHYNRDTKQLEWGVMLRAEGSQKDDVNYTVRILGRHGYEAATLVTSPNTLGQDVASFRQTLSRFHFNSGEKYSEFRSGDRVAEYGLAALVVGGAAAAATKMGLWKGILVGLAGAWKFVLAAAAGAWKLVFAALAAGLASIGKLFKRKGP